MATQQAERANLLHKHERACEPLQVGHWMRLPQSALSAATASTKRLGVSHGTSSHGTSSHGSWASGAGAALPPLGALVLDAKLSRGRSVLVEAYDLQLASAVGAPAMERCLVRFIERTLRLPCGFRSTCSSTSSWTRPSVTPSTRCTRPSSARVMHLATSQGDALKRLSSLLPYVPFRRTCHARLAGNVRADGRGARQQPVGSADRADA